MEEILGTIESILFSQSENGFTIAKLQGKEKTTIVGNMPFLQPGETIKCFGDWISHPKFGKQFSVNTYQIERPCDVNAIQKYLESGLIKGIGPVYAKKIVNAFGQKTLEIIDNEPYKLLEIEGLGKKKVDVIIKSFEEQRSIRDVMIFLRSCGITPAYAQKIYKVYGNQSIQKVQKQPYQLAKEIFGIGFKMADQIASHLGIEKTSNQRIEAGIEYVLSELLSEGHTCYPKEKLIEMTTQVLDVEKELTINSLTQLLEKKELLEKTINDSPFIFLKSLASCEQGIGKEILRIKNGITTIRPMKTDKAIEWVEKELNIKFAEKQTLATINSLCEKMHIITGGPGTGKSTITKGILAITEKITAKIILAAPTGRAAKRLSQITRKKAHTIHSLLEFDFANGGFKKNHENPLKADLIIIDEASMIDTFLMYSLLKAIPDKARVIFVGDIDQLPSVGPGSVLKDLIDSKIICVTILDEIYRQAKGSHIIVNAHKVNQGEFPFLQNGPESDFQFFQEDDPKKIQEKIIDLVINEIPKTKHFEPFEQIQVLSPMRKGEVGIDVLNELLQQKINPSSTPFYRFQKRFHLGDKVMQIKNNYNKNIYNGDVGRIKEIDLEEQIMTIEFDKKEIIYDFSELDEIVLAYAVSVHKYQGSECPCVIIPIHTSHFKLLYRNLLYTAITRGKKLVMIIGSKKALAIAIKNDKILKRFTGLKEALIEAKAQFFPRDLFSI